MLLRRYITTAAQSLPISSIRDQTIVPLSQRVFPSWLRTAEPGDVPVFAQASELRLARLKQVAQLQRRRRGRRSAASTSMATRTSLLSNNLEAMLYSHSHAALSLNQSAKLEKKKRLPPKYRDHTQLNALLSPILDQLNDVSDTQTATALTEQLFQTLLAAFQPSSTSTSELPFHPRLFPSALRSLMHSAKSIHLAEYLLLRYTETISTHPEFTHESPFVEMVNQYIHAKNPTAALSVIDRAARINLAPTSRHLQAPFLLHAAQIDPAIATKALESILTHHHTSKVSTHLYNQLVRHHTDSEVAHRTLLHLAKTKGPDAETFQIIITPDSVYDILTDMENGWPHALRNESVQRKVLTSVWTRSKQQPHQSNHNNNDKSTTLQPVLETATRIERITPLTISASIILAQVYLQSNNLRNSMRVLKQSLSTGPGDVRQISRFIRTHVLPHMHATQRQGVDGFDAAVVYDVLDVWTRLCVQGDGVVSMRDACGVVAVLSNMGELKVLRKLYEGVVCPEREDWDARGLGVAGIREDQWRVVVDALRGEEEREIVAAAFLKAGVGLGVPDLEFGERVVRDYVRICGGVDGRQVALAALLESLLETPKKSKRNAVGEEEEDARVRKLAAGVVVEFVKKEGLTDDAVLGELGKGLAQK
ncbi:hypothetical protein HDU99_002186 [Rhizoclosmatium hyalinum]|nr:hypothetical protein HDU99_002186 [Rhizoclosmatium hyalinum]